MKDAVKKNMRVVIIYLLLFCFGFCVGYLFDRIGNRINQAGAAADVGKYDKASERVERAADAIINAAGNVAEAAREVRVGFDEAGRIGNIAGDIADGVNSAYGGAYELADGIRRVMGILDEAEKRNATVEAVCCNGMD
ncbi:MAG: hypothetical protein FWD24_01120 [Treponema sp.]|nr:hypothetical protein [Treponema sp.]